MSLSIVIPSDAPFERGLVESDRYVRRPKRYPIKSDQACWFSVIYEWWTPQQIHQDVIYRLLELNVDYDIALTDMDYGNAVVVQALTQEVVLTKEFENIFCRISFSMIQEVLDALRDLQLTKTQYFKAKALHSMIKGNI